MGEKWCMLSAIQCASVVGENTCECVLAHIHTSTAAATAATTTSTTTFRVCVCVDMSKVSKRIAWRCAVLPIAMPSIDDDDGDATKA